MIIDQFRPLSDKLLIRLIDEPKTSGKIVIPDTASKEPVAQGKVLAVGPGRRYDDGKIETPTVKRGDRIIFNRYEGDEIELGGEKLVIASERRILAIVSE